MPIYEFQFTLPNGKKKVVERTFKMSECPQEITLEDSGITVTAHRIISRTAAMKTNWANHHSPSDLPPEDAPYMGPTD